MALDEEVLITVAAAAAAIDWGASVDGIKSEGA